MVLTGSPIGKPCFMEYVIYIRPSASREVPAELSHAAGANRRLQRRENLRPALLSESVALRLVRLGTESP
jgi:hypothetical protein